VSRIVESVPDVVAIVISNEEGRVLAALNMQTIEQSHSNDSVSTYEKDVYANTRMIGRIVVGFDVKHRKTVLRYSAIKIYFSGIASIAVCATLILAMLNHVVVGPVQRIHEHLLLLQNNKKPKALNITANKELSHLANTANEFGNVLELRKPSSSKSLLTLINDILDFSKLEAGKLSYEKVEFPLEDLIQECAESVSEAASKNDIGFICEIEQDVPATTIGDPTRLRQIITNLTGNAIKFTNEGMVSIHVARISDQATPDRIKFTISDTGVGISAEAQLKLFNSFEQADSSTTREFGGTGLGLAISRRLVKGMDGEIAFESELGQGSSFWFSLDLPSTDKRTVYENNLIKLNHELKVLLVEPVDSNRNYLVSLLQEQRISVEQAHSGTSALEKISDAAKASVPYDIVLFATVLNDMSSTDFTNSIGNRSELDSVKLIAINTITKVKSNLYTHSNNRIVTQLSNPVGRKGLATALSTAIQSINDHQSGEKANTLNGSQMGKDDVVVEHKHLVSETVDDIEVKVFGDINILVAEDNLVNQYITQSMVESMGFTCFVADNGQIALDILETDDIDMILMDCQMPVLDGFKTTQTIRSTETDSHIPIIALTANAMQEDEVKCNEAGMDSFLTKPIDRSLFEQTIMDTLEELINKRKAELSESKKAA